MATNRWWVDPRDDPSPPYDGPERPLASDESEIVGLLSACKDGRIYDVERWIASGHPLQVRSDVDARTRRKPSAMSLSIASGTIDLTRLLLCNGYRIDLETPSPLDAALERRRWDLVDLLFAWGADPASARLDLVLDTYQRPIFELFWNAGVDLAEGASASFFL